MPVTSRRPCSASLRVKIRDGEKHSRYRLLYADEHREKAVKSENGLLTTIAAARVASELCPGRRGIHGGVLAFSGCANETKLISDAFVLQHLRDQSEDTNGVYVVPAFTGLAHRTGTLMPARFSARRAAVQPHHSRATLNRSPTRRATGAGSDAG
ncbi:hypothetical protein ACNKHS_23600 [Shigella flexneri]